MVNVRWLAAAAALCLLAAVLLLDDAAVARWGFTSSPLSRVRSGGAAQQAPLDEEAPTAAGGGAAGGGADGEEDSSAGGDNKDGGPAAGADEGEPEDGDEEHGAAAGEASPTPSASGSRSRAPKSKRPPSPAPSASRSASRQPPPPPSPSPAASRSPRASSGSAPERFLLVLSTQEGMAGWTMCLEEAAAVAVATNRTLVVPCVRAGAVVPCFPGLVVPVPDGRDPAHLAAARAGRNDPLALPQFREACAGHPAWFPAGEGRAYPLHAYLDAGWLRGLRPGLKLATFDEWAAQRVVTKAYATPTATWRPTPNASAGVPPNSPFPEPPLGPEDVDAHGRRRVLYVPGRGVYVDRALHPTMPSERFLSWVKCYGRHNSGGWHIGFLDCPLRGVEPITAAVAAEGDAADVFVASWYRAPRALSVAPFPPFNPLHALAVQAWVGGPDAVYAVLHWRQSGAVTSTGRLGECAAAMRGVLEGIPGLAPRAVAAATGAVPGALTSFNYSDAASVRAVLGAVPPGCDGGANASTVNAGPCSDGAPLAPGRPRVVLVADLPAPSNPCETFYELTAWGERDLARARTAQAAAFLRAGYAKYDAHPSRAALDAGVLAIRDVLLGSRATWFLTCHAYHTRADVQPEAAGLCGPCFFFSAYIHRVVLARKAAGLPSNEIVFNVSAANLVPPPPSPAPLPARAPSRRAPPPPEGAG